MLDFAVLPPEINSARIYTGPGPGPMLAAATAWSVLATETECAAHGYHLTVADLAAGWQGAAALRMLAAAAPVTAWLHSTAAVAAQTAEQAAAAAGAFESAFAMTVPPTVIAANRALWATLVATNFFGQNTPAIAATEAHYLQMWIQDAVAMYTYAAASATAGHLPAFPPPAPHANPAGLGAPPAADGPATMLGRLAAPAVTFTSPTLLDYLEHVPNLVNTMLSSNNAVASVRSIDITNQRLAFQTAREAPRPVLVTAPAVAATMGGAPWVGGLSVPTSWGAPPPTIRPVAVALTFGAAPAPPPVATPMPGGALATSTVAGLERREDRRQQPKNTPVLVRPAAAR